MRFIRLTIISFILIAGMTSCFEGDKADSISVANNNKRANAPVPLKGQFYVLPRSKTPKTSADFQLNKASITEDQLDLQVSYGGGCEDHIFSVYWDGNFDEAEGVTSISLIINHIDNNDGCEAYITETVSFDLTKVKEAFLIAHPTKPGQVTLKLSGQGKQLDYTFKGL